MNGPEQEAPAFTRGSLHQPQLTPQQEADGFQPTMLRGSAEELQAELARRCRVRSLPLPLAPSKTP